MPDFDAMMRRHHYLAAEFQLLRKQLHQKIAELCNFNEEARKAIRESQQISDAEKPKTSFPDKHSLVLIFV